MKSGKLILSNESIKDKDAWARAGAALPAYDLERVAANTRERPAWIHFGSGNIFRAFLAAAQQKLLNEGLTDTGILAVKSGDFQVIEKIGIPYDHMSLLVRLKSDGTTEREVLASVTDTLRGDRCDTAGWNNLEYIFRKPSLQMVSFTITEKGYRVREENGTWISALEKELRDGPENCKHVMSLVTALLYERYLAGKLPVALVSMDNCAANGSVLSGSILDIAACWIEQGFMEQGFMDYLNDEKTVAFPWTMIDKITPHPSEDIKRQLEADGIVGMDILKTGKGALIAPFVNAEEKEYLVIEDRFPIGRPPLEAAGIYFTDRKTVDLVEKMKVGTCLNPLHTALAVFGCLLGYKSIAAEMQDPDLDRLVRGIAFLEALKVVSNPGIIDPVEFVREVLDQRFPNPFIPDTPQRIAADTSQKIPVRFGQTLRSYADDPGLDPAELRLIPLVFAGWFRYLLGVDDEGKAMELSPDPRLPELRQALSGMALGKVTAAREKLVPLLESSALFGVNLFEAGLAERVVTMFQEMAAAPGRVRATLNKYVNQVPVSGTGQTGR